MDKRGITAKEARFLTSTAHAALVKPAPKQRKARKPADGTKPAAKRKPKEASGDKKLMLIRVLERWAPEILPLLIGEYQFAKWLPKPRMWKTDWMILKDIMWGELGIMPPTNQGIVGVAIEIDGGQWAVGGGRHNSDSDRWKNNTYSTLNYLLLRFSPEMLEDDPFLVIAQIRQACKAAEIRLPGAGMHIPKLVLDK